MTDLREDLRRAGQAVAPPEDAFERLLVRRDRHRRNERLTAATVAALMAVAGMGGALYVLLSPGAARTRTGDIGGSPGVDLSMGPGQYSYVDRVILLTGQTTIETWWGPDGSGRVESSGDDPNYSVPPSQAYGPGDFPIESDLSELSTDPATLADQIGARSTPGGASPQPDITPGPGQDDQTGELWRAVTDILDMPNATPELKAAVFHVAAGITGVELVAEATDPVGRQAVLLQVDTENEHHELYFDPDSLQPLAAVDRSLDETWSISTIVIAAGIVDSTDSTPDPGLIPPPTEEIPEAQGQGGFPALSPAPS